MIVNDQNREKISDVLYEAIYFSVKRRLSCLEEIYQSPVEFSDIKTECEFELTSSVYEPYLELINCDDIVKAIYHSLISDKSVILTKRYVEDVAE
jgi:hypothetical protein